MCQIRIYSISGDRLAPDLPPARLVVQGDASRCDAVIVRADRPLSAGGSSEFGPLPVVDGLWAVRIVDAHPALLCGGQVKLTARCVDDPTCESLLTTLTLTCYVVRPQCPDVELVPAEISSDCKEGKRRVRLRATLRGASSDMTAQWELGDERNSRSATLVVPAGGDVPVVDHDYATGDYEARFVIYSPPDCAGSTGVRFRVPPCGDSPDPGGQPGPGTGPGGEPGTTPPGGGPGGEAPPSGGGDGGSGVEVQPPPLSWPCRLTEAIMILAFIAALVVGLFTVYEITCGVLTIPAAGPGFWFVLGLIIALFYTLTNIFTTLLAIVVVCALLLFFRCKVSVCRLIEDFDWAYHWGSFVCAIALAILAVIPLTCPGPGIYISIIGFVSLWMLTWVLRRPCRVLDRFSLPWMR